MSLPTGCAPLDELLQGGLEEDAITLVFGEGGSGKTNLGLQCARAATARGQRVAFVDTEGVSARRLEQVFSADEAASPGRVLFYNPYTIGEQEQMVRKTTLLQDLGLIVVDSINMHYRLHIDGGDDAERVASRSLFAQLHHLTGHARRAGVPVLVTGQVYGGEDATQPFARRVMEHLVKALLRFEKRPDGTRRATILKHRSLPEGRQAAFRIGATGLEPAHRRVEAPPEQDEASGHAPPVREGAGASDDPGDADGPAAAADGAGAFASGGGKRDGGARAGDAQDGPDADPEAEAAPDDPMEPAARQEADAEMAGRARDARAQGGPAAFQRASEAAADPAAARAGPDDDGSVRASAPDAAPAPEARGEDGRAPEPTSPGSPPAPEAPAPAQEAPGGPESPRRRSGGKGPLP